jgi:hypothetical protein
LASELPEPVLRALDGRAVRMTERHAKLTQQANGELHGVLIGFVEGIPPGFELIRVNDFGHVSFIANVY